MNSGLGRPSCPTPCVSPPRCPGRTDSLAGRSSIWVGVCSAVFHTVIVSSDTENTFRPDRLRPIADRFNLDQEAVLDNVLYSRAYTSEQQMELLDFVCAKFHEEPGIFKLLIVDSVMALFRVDFSGRGELAERQQNLAQMMSKLQKISEEYNVAVLVTNQMTSDPG